MSKTLETHNYHGIDATIIADSLSPQGDRITTMVVTFPRIVLAEFNTHRMFSRNSASSRAIPFKKMVETVQKYPFIPIAWQKDHKGMQGTEYFTDLDHIDAHRHNWIVASEEAIRWAEIHSKNNVTKQLCNRLLEPFIWHTVIVTATEWENFFKLRCPQYSGKLKTWRSWKDMLKEARTDGTLSAEDLAELENACLLERLQTNIGGAEIHISLLAEKMWDAMNESTPRDIAQSSQISEMNWHIPFIDNLDESLLLNLALELNPELDTVYGHSKEVLDLRIKIATARCARVSYMNFDGSTDYQKDIELHDRLLASGHMSPFEHCARVMNKDEYNSRLYKSNGESGWCRNFRGFIQYREVVENVGT